MSRIDSRIDNWFFENSESSQSCAGIFDPRDL